MTIANRIEAIIGVALLSTCMLAVLPGALADQATLQSGAHYQDKSDLESVRKDLGLLDEEVASQNYEDASAIIGKSIKARSIYRNYLTRAAAITEELFFIRDRLDAEGRTLSLQQLSGLTHHLKLSRTSFQEGFTHGEEKFQTYQLIRKAVECLEDAAEYWRIANSYRRFYRGGAQDRREDAELLETRIQTALNAIDELKLIIETRKALHKDLEEDD